MLNILISRVNPFPGMGAASDRICNMGGTPLAVVKNGEVLGLIYLKDIVKGGIKERFTQSYKWALKRL